MKSVFLHIILFLSLCSQLAAQPLQSGEVFDNRFENHTKALSLFGHVKKVTEIDSASESKNYHPKKPLNFKRVWAFNADGNYNEMLFYRGDGTLVSRDVFNYNSKGQLLTKISFDGLRATETSRHVCTMDVTHNSVRSEFYITGNAQSFASILKIYNKDGKEIERRLKYPEKPVEILKFTYDKKGNQAGWDGDGNKTVFIYDENNFLVEQQNYEKDGTLFMRKFFKNDKWGNHTEEKTSLDGGPFETFNSAYTYDTHNNWITKKTTNKGDGHQTTTRAIEYY